MDEYIKRKELAEMIENNVNLPFGEGYTGKDHELVEWCKGECIRIAHCLPFVCDVVPKSEVDRLNAVMKEMDEQRAYTINMLGESLEKAKREADKWHARCVDMHSVAEARSKYVREIFEEIEKHGRKMQSSDFSGEFWDIAILMSDIAELKKKYTEGDT